MKAVLPWLLLAAMVYAFCWLYRKWKEEGALNRLTIDGLAHQVQELTRRLNTLPPPASA